MDRPLVPNESTIEEQEFVIKGRVAGQRLDQYLVTRFVGYTRSYIQKLIDNGKVSIDGKIINKASTKIRTGNRIVIELPKLEPLYLKPEQMPLDIIYEDDVLAVLNKPPDLVIHPARGHMSGTLVNALLAYFEELSDVNDVYRPGIIHRLDRFTSGLLLIAKNNHAHAAISQQFEQREVQKEYLALVEGVTPTDENTVCLPLGMDPRNRERMAICHGGKPAETYYRTIAKYPKYTLLHVFPKTGRTHQIRIHLKSQGYPIVADTLYDAKELTKQDVLLCCEEQQRPVLEQCLGNNYLEDAILKRQALHAWKITFTHPTTKSLIQFTAPLPDDLKTPLRILHQFWPSKKFENLKLL